jgi:hypothetical protein
MLQHVLVATPQVVAGFLPELGPVEKRGSFFGHPRESAEESRRVAIVIDTGHGSVRGMVGPEVLDGSASYRGPGTVRG